MIVDPPDLGAWKVTLAPPLPVFSARRFVGGFGLPVTVTVIVPWTAREGSANLSLTLKPTVITPEALGVMDTVVPDEETVASPEDTRAPSRVIGASGKGFVAADATSTLTVCFTLVVSV